MIPERQRILTRRDLEEWLGAELAYYRADRGEVAWFLQRTFGFGEQALLAKHQVLLRRAEYHRNVGHRLRYALVRLRLDRMQNKYCLHIPLNTCGKGFRLMHLGPVLINGRAALGAHCVLHMCSSVVAKGISDAAPTLGEGVILGYGACVVGGVEVANNVAVGANALVCKSVDEPGVSVAGVPAKVVGSGGSCLWSHQSRTGDLLDASDSGSVQREGSSFWL